MSPSAIEKSGELSRSSSVVPTSTYGLSVKRCAAGRSTPTSASTLPGKLSGPNTRNVRVGELHDRSLEMARRHSRYRSCSAAAVKSSIIPFVASIRAVAAPTVRRLSSQPAPGAPVKTVGAMADSSGYASGVRAVRTQDQIGVAPPGSCPGRASCGCRPRADRARLCRDRRAGHRSRRAVRRRRCGTAGPARTARRAGHRRAPRSVAPLSAHRSPPRHGALSMSDGRPDRRAVDRARRTRLACADCPAHRRPAIRVVLVMTDGSSAGEAVPPPSCRSRRARSPRRRSARPPRQRSDAAPDGGSARGRR